MAYLYFRAGGLAVSTLAAALWLGIAPALSLAYQDGAQSKPTNQKATPTRPGTEYAEGGGDGWAKFRVARLKPSTLVPERQWKTVLPMLEGAQVFEFPPQQKGRWREIDFEVLADGPIIMGASWTQDGPRTPDWYNTRTSVARMEANGWEPIGNAVRRYGTRDDEYTLYRKMVRKGERYVLHTRSIWPPVLVVPKPEQRAEVLAAKPLNIGAGLVSESNRGARRETSEPAPPQVLLLDTYESSYGGTLANRGLLVREVLRQAVLLAGREGLKLQTRDAALGEQFPDTSTASSQLLGIVPAIASDATSRTTLFRGSIEEPEVLWYRAEVFSKADLLEEMVKTYERHSRTSLVDALRSSGFQGEAITSQDAAPVDETIQAHLRNMTFPEQFRAVRSLHRLIRDEGDSPERLSALARAYANLGLLTEVHWNAAHAAYKARALLYAQRIASKWPTHPLGYWTRGYVRTVVGRHAAAITDFERADKLNQDNADSMPAWARWAKVACCGENELHTADKSAKETEIARLLSMVQLEQFIEIPVVLKSVQRVLEVSPDCFRAVEVMASVADLEARDAAAAMGPQLANLHLYERLTEWDDLPDSIKELIRTRNVSTEKPEHSVRLELIDALNAAGSARLDTGEPSFSAMASLLEELTFLHVLREVQVLAEWHHQPADELLQAREPLVRNPAYRAYLQLYSADRQKASEALEVLPKELDRVSLSRRNTDLLDKLFFTSKRKLSSELGAITQGHLDPVLSDLWFVRQRNQDQASKSHFAELMTVCPNAPAAVIASIRLDWKQIGQQQADDLGRRYWDVPPVLFALAKQHRSDKDWPRAVALLKRHIKLLPDVSAYQQLAEAYLEQGDLDRWRATFDEFLTTQPEQGLDHTHVRGEIALKLRGYRRWQEALPYAEAAAESGEGWALILAGSNHEALQHWDEAEAYYRRCSARYSDAGTSWYYFCRRTGQGDPASALEPAMKVADLLKERARGGHLWHLGFLAQLENNAVQALVYLEPAAKDLPNPMVWLQTLLVAHEVKRHDVRDQFVNELIERSSKYREKNQPRPRLALEAFARLLKAKFAKDGPLTFTDEEITAVFEKADDDQRAEVRFAIGRLLDLQGDAEQAAEYYKQALAHTRIEYYARTLSGYYLGKLGVPASSYRELMLGKEAKQ